MPFHYELAVSRASSDDIDEHTFLIDAALQFHAGLHEEHPLFAWRDWDDSAESELEFVMDAREVNSVSYTHLTLPTNREV